MINMELPISTIHRHPEQNLFAVGGKSFTKLIKLNEDGEFKLQKILKATKSSNKQGTSDMQFNPFFNTILASTTLLNSQILIWDYIQSNHDKLVTNIGNHDQLINRLNWNTKNPKLLASCSQDGYIKIFDFKNVPNDKSPVIKIHNRDKIRDCQFSPFDEHLLLASYNSGLIKLFDTRNTSISVKDYYKHEADVLSIDWCPINKDKFVAGSMDKQFTIWDVGDNEPCRSYKTNFGVSRVKFWKKNPQYILTSFQTNNNFASLWNLEIQNIAEYTYKGHKDVVTGFCWDITETKLITGSKDSKIIIHDFYNGNRPLDNFFTNFCKLTDETHLIYYTDLLPTKKSLDKLPDDFEPLYKQNSNKKFILFYKRIKLNWTYDRNTVNEVLKRFKYIVRVEVLRDLCFSNTNENNNSNNISTFEINNNDCSSTFINNNNNNNINNNNISILNQSQGKINMNNSYYKNNYTNNRSNTNYINNNNNKNINDNNNNNSNNLNNNKYNINHTSSNPNLNEKNINKNNYNINNTTKRYIHLNKFDSITEIIRSLIQYNLKLSQNFNLYHYYLVFNELEFLTKSKYFEQNYVDETVNNNLDNKNQLLYGILMNNVLQIINFLIENNNDIILAALVTYIFQDYFNFENKFLTRIQYNCVEYVRSFKLYTHAAKLTKFTHSETVKKLFNKNTLIILSCKNCNAKYDSTKPGICNGCELPFVCNVCNINCQGGLVQMNFGCSHGGHPNHLSEWYNAHHACPKKY